ncbi:MAG: thioesterase family protein [Bacillota bacterium]
MIQQFEIGTKGIVQKRITREDTALNFGSGALKNLLATPTLAALMIEAAVKAIDPKLPQGFITIGKTLDINHENPTVQGMTCTVSAELVEQNENKLVFDITAYDELGQIGKGKHERYIVNRDILMIKVDERCR